MPWPFSFFSSTLKAKDEEVPPPEPPPLPAEPALPAEPQVVWYSSYLKWFPKPNPHSSGGKKEIRKAAKIFAENYSQPSRSELEAEYAKKVRRAVMEAKLKNDAIDASEARILKGIK